MKFYKITIVLLTITCLQVSAKSLSQQITLSQKRSPIIKVFDEIKKQTGYRFWYEDKLIARSKPVDISVENASLEQVLELVFRNQPFTYEIIGKVIALKEKTERAESINAPPAPEQDKRITGVVKDTLGNPIPGVSYSIKGTRMGGATDANGRFSITVPDNNAILVFSSVGFQSREISAGSGTVLDVILTASATGLSDVVVTALGIKRNRASLGYAISTIRGEELTKAGATMNPFLALYGKASGVGVNVGAAGPQGGIRINIRGAASMNPDQNTRPLFVVDGVILADRRTSIGGNVGAGFDYGAGINDINAADIESIEILKGAKATVLYGSDAANGVVLITTKSGRNTRGFGMTGSYQYTVEQPANYLKLQNTYGLGANIYDTAYATINGQRTRVVPNYRYNFGPEFDGADVMMYDSSFVKNMAHPDNYRDLFQTGFSSTANVAIAGSNEKGALRASYTNYYYKDIISDNSWQKRNTFSFNGSIKASELATFEVVSNIYNVSSQNRRGMNSQSIAWGFPRDYSFDKVWTLYTDELGYKRDLSNMGVPQAVNELGTYLWELEKNRYRDEKVHFITSAKVTLNFTKYLFLVGQAGLDYDNTTYKSEKSVDRILPAIAGGSFSAAKENTTVQTYQALLNFDKNLAGEDLHLYAFAGGIYRLRSSEYLGSSTVGGLTYPDWYSFANEAGTLSADNLSQVRNYNRGSDVLYSAVASATLSWRNELYLELQGRQDWNSTLPPENNSYFYPGASITWNYTERFSIPKMNRGQVRFAWADVGNGTTRYFANNLYSFNRLPGTDAVSVQPPGNILPGALKPERKREFEIGINNTFFRNNRIVLDVSYYRNNIYDQIMNLAISPTSGSNALKINAGNVRNWGLEVAITGTPVVTKDLRWDITVNSARQGSKVIKLYPGITQNFLYNLINGSAAAVRADQGKPYGQIVMNDYQRDDAGNRVVNENGIYILNSQSYIDVANIMPRFYGGILSDLHYRSFDFRIGLDFKSGGTVFSYTNNRMFGLGQLENTLQYRDEEHGGLAYYIDANNRKIPWQHNQPAPADAVGGRVYHDGVILPGVKKDANDKYVQNDIIASASDYYLSYVNDLASSFPPDGLHKNNYVKVREVALAYTLPRALTERLRLQKATISLAGRNLFYIYKSIPNIDSESALGADVYVENTVYPGQRTYSLGVTVAF